MAHVSKGQAFSMVDLRRVNSKPRVIQYHSGQRLGYLAGSGNEVQNPVVGQFEESKGKNDALETVK